MQSLLYIMHSCGCDLFTLELLWLVYILKHAVKEAKMNILQGTTCLVCSIADALYTSDME